MQIKLNNHIELNNQLNNQIKLNTQLKKAMIETLVANYKTYDIYDAQNQPLKMIRAGKNNDGGYVVPEIAFEKADVLLGYGILYDASFEEYFANVYKKPSYGFDCSIKSFASNAPLFTFIDECIGTAETLSGTGFFSGKISRFHEQLKRLNIQDKKLFIKMDIETAEFMAFNDIYPYSQNITGIAIELHMQDFQNVINGVKLLSNLSNDFLLVHVHANDASRPTKYVPWMEAENLVGSIPTLVELTFINKSLVARYELSKNQSHPKSIDMPVDPKNKDVEYEVRLINPVN